MAMTFNRIIFISLVALLALTIPLSSAAAKLTLAEGINKAGRQRMLTQRMVKTYCQMGMELRYRKSEKQLNAAIYLFDTQLEELQQFAITTEVKNGLSRVNDLWGGVKTAVSSKVKRENIEQLRTDAEELLIASHKVVLMLQDLSGTSQGKLVNIAGRQRMLSQRIANLYLLQAWGFEKEPFTSDYKTAISEFDAALNLLKKAPENTKKISDALEAVSLQWGVFQHSAKLKKGKYIPALITQSADKILSQMNTITGMYTLLPAK